MDAGRKPLFLFLLPAEAPAMVDADPFLAVMATDGTQATILVDKDGVEEDFDDLDAFFNPTGLSGTDDFLMDMTGRQIAGKWSKSLLDVLCAIAPTSADLADIALMMPRQPDIYEGGAVARTRDALVWVTCPNHGCRAPVKIANYIDPAAGLHLLEAFRAALIAALARQGVALPEGMELTEALDALLVGVVACAPSAHQALAQQGRIAEDTRLFASLWNDLGTYQRPVVPVFL